MYILMPNNIHIYLFHYGRDKHMEMVKSTSPPRPSLDLDLETFFNMRR